MKTARSMFKVLVFTLSLFVSCSCVAQVGPIQIKDIIFKSASNSCADVLIGLMLYYNSPVQTNAFCENDPVVVGTLVRFDPFIEGRVESTLAGTSNSSSVTASPFVLSVADGAALSMLIIGVWVAAFALKSLMRVVNPPDAE